MKGGLKIKVCGMVHPGNIEEVCSLEPDYVGYIFYRGSRRYVGERPDPAIFRIPGREIRKVGVFVDEAIDAVKEQVLSSQLDLVQLHGGESPAYCRELSVEGIQVIKALKPDAIHQPSILQSYSAHVRAFLFDNPGKGFGGTGRKFNWAILSQYSAQLPFLLSGGIGPEDASSIGQIALERLFGVDLNSRFETSPGVKDIQLLRKFMEEIS